MSAAILAMVSCLGHAPASPPSPDRVQWQAPATCPSDADLELALQAAIPDSAPQARIEALVDQEGGTWRVRVVTHLDDAQQQRELTASDCESLARATAVIIATAYEDIVTAQARQTQAEAESEQPPVVPRAQAVTAIASPPAPTRSAMRRHRWLARVDLGYGSGTSPQGTFGVGLALGWQRRLLRVELLGRYWVPQPLTSRGVAWAEIQSGTAAALACVVPGAGRVRVPLCAGIEVGGVRAEGRDVDQAIAGTEIWEAALARVGVEIRMTPRVAWVLGAELAVPWTHLDVSASPEQRFFLPEVAARAMLGIQTRLGP